MTRKSAASCSKCGRPIRKGANFMEERWATAGGMVEGHRAATVWLLIRVHSRCLPEWTRERKARKARREADA